MCHCTLWETEVQECPCESLRSNFGQILIFFGSFLWHPGQSWRKHCKSCNTLQHGSKIDIYCCKKIFFSPPGWTPPLPRVTEQHPGSPLKKSAGVTKSVDSRGQPVVISFLKKTMTVSRFLLSWRWGLWGPSWHSSKGALGSKKSMRGRFFC